MAGFVSRAVAALGLTAVLVAVTACGNSGGVGGQKDATQASAGGTVTLKYWTWFPEATTLKAAIAQFEQRNPQIKIELRTFQAEEYQKQLPVSLGGGQQVDVVGVQVSAMTNTVRANLRPVADWESGLAGDWRTRLQSKPVEQSEKIAQDGKLYAIPMGSLGSAVMYYNPDLLGRADVAKVPATVEEWADAAAKVKALGDGITPVANAGEPYWQDEVLFTLAAQNSGRLSDQILYEGKSFDSPEVVQALADYKSLVTKGVIEKSTLDSKLSQATELFTSGKAAFYLDGTWSMSLLSKAYRQQNKIDLASVGVAALPLTRTGATPVVRGFAEGGLGIPKSSAHVKEAAKFIEFMTVGDGVAVWGKDLVLAPAKKDYRPDTSVLDSAEAQTGFATVADLIANAPSNRDTVQAFNNTVEGNTILEVLRGKTTPQDAARHLQSEWTSGRYPHPTR